MLKLPETNTVPSRNTPTNTHPALDPVPEITPEMVELYLRRGKRMRSEYIFGCMRKLFSAGLKAPVAPAVQQRSNPSQSLLNALTAMRSSLEVLRDSPEISQQERIRFARNALTEEARAERILKDMFGGTAKPV